MVIEKYGVFLKRLNEDKIEMIRIWRNSPSISQFMEYRETITPEMQKEWFRKINNDNNFYFIIHYDNKEIGLINLKDVDYFEKVAECGIFIYDKDFLNSTISIRSTLAICDFAFEHLKLDSITTHVLSDNKNAITYNKFFGSVIEANQENIYNQRYVRKREVYYKKREKILKMLNLTYE